MKILLNKEEWAIWGEIKRAGREGITFTELMSRFPNSILPPGIFLAPLDTHGLIDHNMIDKTILYSYCHAPLASIKLDDEEDKPFCPLSPERLPCSKNCALYDTDKDGCSLNTSPVSVIPSKPGVSNISLTFKDGKWLYHGPYHSETDYSERTVTYPYPWYTTKTGE